MTASAVSALATLGPAGQRYLLEARQMQALSFAVHIPLVCFGVAFPALLLFVEWLYLRSGDELYRTIARRWTKVLVVLFVAGVVTGTLLSFELGILWPNFTATFGSVFGLGFAVEGFSFFLEAIFIGIYVYGWDRLSPRAHFASGLPIALAGFTGSLTVIAVNGWMNYPTRRSFSPPTRPATARKISSFASAGVPSQAGSLPVRPRSAVSPSCASTPIACSPTS